ncbi:MAG: N-acetylneuraminate synthase, partial [Candidatus Scalindua sp.]|nr:N-acetylneuraminate synthase [Candidatus Scalindua sp.]
LRKGKKISEKDLVCLRPNRGIDARDYKEVVGKKVIKKVCKNQELSKNDFI